ncbi:glycine--tRNA ligase subunit beta [Derxia gummosa]|uniref:Glycine--tRNA ligase beta subunit n=1 Tax=Derxia gummosa DSM 723 TaxID=1121388 RepID=A0A8B6X6W5_9BURK|nr:glycine--tRNA ligase subunit beta [Derxia gummosa]
MNASLLVELFCEELPPKALQRLGDAFADGVRSQLLAKGFLEAASAVTAFATPRRLAVRITDVREKSPDTPKRDKLLPVSIAFDAAGNAQPPLLKKLASLGLSEADIPNLKRESDGKAEALFHEHVAPGVALDAVLEGVVRDAIARLPIPKVMSYQLADLSTVQFVRPAHRLVALHGKRVLPISVLGLTAGNRTLGHRFLAKQPEVTIPDADHYEAALEHVGRVVASYGARRQRIVDQLAASAKGDVVIQPDALLDEVNALVEWPVVVEGRFDEAFLEVPQECLILTMQLNQKYFAVADAAGKLRNRFLLVSNLEAEDSSKIIGGNERVLRARLADAKFFYDTDRKQPLASRLDLLKPVVYHNKLGSQFERVQRIASLAKYIAGRIEGDAALVPALTLAAERAATLAKCDLVTGMVGEFPELQGVMGGYYARHDGEAEAVAQAIDLQYRPRLDAAALTGADGKINKVAAAVYLAERLETLVGIWGIGLQPTGEKDPFGLRRAALGVIDVVELLGESAAKLELREAMAWVKAEFPAGALPADGKLILDIEDFIYERYRNQLAQDADRAAVDAVLALRPNLADARKRLAAVVEFRGLAEAEALAAANKRIGNILKKAEGATGEVDPALLQDDAEVALYTAIAKAKPASDTLFKHGNYAEALKALAHLRGPVDAFFNDVMVMAENPQLRANRIALLRWLHTTMNRVADLARLAG